MSEAKRYRKKPVVIEAMYYDGTSEGRAAVVSWADGDISACGDPRKLRVDTLEGHHIIDPNYYVIRGVEGEFYGCEPRIFEKTYEAAEA